MATNKATQQRIKELARQLAAALGEVDEAEGVCWLDAAENQAVRMGDAVATALIQQRAEERPADEEASCPNCGKLARYLGMRQRALISRRGPAVIPEPEYYCPCCRKAFFPSDPSHRR